MRLKLHLVCTNPEGFLRGDYNHCFIYMDNEILPEEWISCGWHEIDVEVDVDKAIGIVTTVIDKEIGKHTAALNVLESRKKDLLCLDAPK